MEEEQPFATVPFLAMDARKGVYVTDDEGMDVESPTSSPPPSKKKDRHCPLEAYEKELQKRERAYEKNYTAFMAQARALAEQREPLSMPLTAEAWEALQVRKAHFEAEEQRIRQQPQLLVQRSLGRQALEPRIQEACLAHINPYRLVALAMRQALSLSSSEQGDYYVAVVRDCQQNRVIAYTVVRKTVLAL